MKKYQAYAIYEQSQKYNRKKNEEMWKRYLTKKNLSDIIKSSKEERK